jgi:formiminoglutamase
MSLWQGRDDTSSEGPDALRWHQRVVPWREDAPPGLTLLGFASDEGVRRNQGRIGAAAGPPILRQALASLAVMNDSPLYDAADVVCRDGSLELAQEELTDLVARLIRHRQRPVVLGGGHETAWGTFQGLARSFPGAKLAILNLDAHFDLRPGPPGHSGTPFRQMAEWFQTIGGEFRYACLGIAEPANTRALFRTARDLGVMWKADHELAPANLGSVHEEIDRFLAGADVVYLSLDLDVLPGSIMPAVSAPAARGVSLETIETLIQWVAGTGKLTAADVVEFNPTYDRDGLAARVAARLVWQFACHWTAAPPSR